MKHLSLPGYDTLRKQVEAVFLEGRHAVEKAKILTYRRTGELIHKHIFKNKERADFGTKTVEKLGKDLGVSSDTLWDCVRFYRKISITDARREMPRNLSWTHYRELMKISDNDLMLDFMKRADKGEWTSRELASKIQTEVTHSTDPKGKKASGRLVERRGKVRTYRAVDYEGELRIDVGFAHRYILPEGARGLKVGDIVESFSEDVKDKNGKVKKEFSFKKSGRSESDLYTYPARIEHIVDGDTLRVVIDEGFYMETLQYLRYRGIDCPEINTEAGKKAKAFVEKELKGLDRIIIVSSKSDKFDRYLADVYYQKKGEKEEKFLNQLLLNTGHAVRMEF